MIRGSLAAALALITLLTACSHPPTTPPVVPRGTTAVQSPTPTAIASATDWPTYHGDPARTGFITSPSAFTAIAPAWQSESLDGDVYAEPLVAGGSAFVATEDNTLYAFDVHTGSERWHTHLGDPVAAAGLPCGDVRPVSGITGTPVIDVANSLLYVVAFLSPGHHELFALGITDGIVRFHRPVDPSGANPLTHQQRAALALANHTVYVAFGGLYGDCGDYHGWVVGAQTGSASGDLLVYQVPSAREAGIWAPSGITVSGDGNLYVATGNSASTGAYDFNDAVIELSPDLHERDFWAPADWVALSRSDTDLGSLAPALLDNGLVFQAGKNGGGYLLRTTHLGGLGASPAASIQACRAAFGGTAYAAGVVYLPCTDGLVALTVGPGPTLTVAWRSAPASAEPPIVTGDTVWFVDRNTHFLYALDATTGAIRARVSVGATQHFTTPTASGGELFIAADGRLRAFSLD